MASVIRRILVKLKPFITGNKIADGEDVELSPTNFDSNLSSSITDVQQLADAVDNLDLTGTQFAPIAVFNADLVLDASSLGDYLNRNAVYGAALNKITTVTLPDNSLTMFTDGTPIVYPYFIRFSHLGGTSRLSTNNRLRINAFAGQNFEIGGNTVTSTNRGRGDVIEFQIRAAGQPFEATFFGAEDPRTSTLPDAILTIRPQMVNLSGSTTLAASLLNVDVNTGYSYIVSIGGNYFGTEVRAGDIIVSKVDNPDLTQTSTDWQVISGASNFPVTSTESHFLGQVTENDNRVIAADVGDEATLRIWMTPGLFATAPFIDPATDPNNPRPGQTEEYYGSVNQEFFTLDENLGNYYLYLGITPSYFNNVAEADIQVRIINIDGTIHATYSLADDFHRTPALDNASHRYFAYSTSPDTSSFTTLFYGENQTIRVYRTTIQRHFRLNPSTVNVDQNVVNLPEGSLEQSVQAKLNRDISLDFDDQEKLDAIVENTTVATGQPVTTIWWKTGGISEDINEYHQDDSIPPAPGGAETLTVLTEANVVITSFAGVSGGTATFARIEPSVIRGKNMYTVVVTGGADIFGATADITTINTLEPNSTFKIGYDNLDQDIINRLSGHEGTLPEVLQVLSANSEVTTFDNTNFVSVHPHFGIKRAFVVLKNKPELGDPYPITSDLFVNEISNSLLTLTPPATLSNVLIPRMVDGSLVNGVAAVTNGAMEGPGLQSDSFLINTQDSSNFRLNIGVWFVHQSTAQNHIIGVKRAGLPTFRTLVETAGTNLQIVRGNDDGTATTTDVTRHLYTNDGDLSYVFSGTDADQADFRVYTARAYTINATRAGGGTGTATGTFTIDDINTAKSQPITFDFGGGYTQAVTVSYVPDTTIYGGSQHVIRLAITQITGNSATDVNQLTFSVVYVTTENIKENSTATRVVQQSGALVVGRLHKVIFSFRRLASGANEDWLECIYTLYGYDSDGNPHVYSESNIVFRHSVYELDWSQIRIGGGAIVVQNIQGFFLNPDTPLFEYPLHSTLSDWLSHHDVKETDYIWDNVNAPSMDVEEIVVNENMYLPNQIFTNVDESARYSVRINTAGDGFVITELT